MTATRRVDRGGSHWYLLDGQKCPGVTTILSSGVPKPALPGWAARMVAQWAVDNVTAWTGLERAAAVDLLRGVPWRDRDLAARRGQEIHRLAEQVTAGDEVEVPEELVGHVDAFVAFLDEWGPTNEMNEVTVGSRTHRYMGTFDLLADIDGERWLLDIKTGVSGVYPETGLQLAAYRFAEFALIDEKEVPMPAVDRCGVIWLRADGYDLVEVRADEEIFAVFLAAQQMASFLARDDVVGLMLTPQGRRKK